MKLSRPILLLTLAVFCFSCKKDEGPYVQVKNIENLIYEEIRDYRVAEGENGPFVHQYFVVGEAQIYSYKMANDVVEVNTDGLDVHWDALNEKYSFYNHQAIVMKTSSTLVEEIFDEMLLLAGAEATLLEDVTQCGVGVESDMDGDYYITVLLMKADS